MGLQTLVRSPNRLRSHGWCCKETPARNGGDDDDGRDSIGDDDRDGIQQLADAAAAAAASAVRAAAAVPTTYLVRSKTVAVYPIDIIRTRFVMQSQQNKVHGAVTAEHVPALRLVHRAVYCSAQVLW